MKTKFFLIVLFFSAIFLFGCTKKPQNTLLVNPASIYCEENGGVLQLIEDFAGSYGLCLFPDGTFCEERAYYNGECGPSEINDKSSILDFQSCIDAWYAIMESHPRQCKDWEWNTFVEVLKEKNEIETNIDDQNDDVFCAMDAKQCPDWSYVSRVPPSCEFAACPDDNKKTLPLDQEKDLQKILEKCKPWSTWLSEDNIECMEEIIDLF